MSLGGSSTRLARLGFGPDPALPRPSLPKRGFFCHMCHGSGRDQRGGQAARLESSFSPCL